MENQFQQGFGGQVEQPLPNSTAVLVLGIVSIVGCFCYGLPGTIAGIIALVLSSKANALYRANPGGYTASSKKNLDAGRICAIIGLSISLLFFVIVILAIAFVGMEALRNPEQFMNQY